MEHKEYVCSDSECQNTFVKYKSTDKYCSSACFYKNQKSKPKKHYIIPKKSKKRAKLDIEYLKLKHDFMNLPENKICPVYGTATVDIHHKKGRVGFADDWARQNNIPLLIDVRFFLAVSRKGHDKIEKNPDWAKDMGYSVDRLC